MLRPRHCTGSVGLLPRQSSAPARIQPYAFHRMRRAGLARQPVFARLETQLQNIRPRLGRMPAAPSRSAKFEDARQPAERTRTSGGDGSADGCNENACFALFSASVPVAANAPASIPRSRNMPPILIASMPISNGSGPTPVLRRDSHSPRDPWWRAPQNTAASSRAAVARGTTAGSGGLSIACSGPGPVPRILPCAGQRPNGGLSGVSGTYNTVCVRTCDGASSSRARSPPMRAASATDEKPVRTPPGRRVDACFSTAIPASDSQHAVSVTQPAYNLVCPTRSIPQAWTTAAVAASRESWCIRLKNIDDTTVEQGDIVVNAQRATAIVAAAYRRPRAADPCPLLSGAPPARAAQGRCKAAAARAH